MRSRSTAFVLASCLMLASLLMPASVRAQGVMALGNAATIALKSGEPYAFAGLWEKWRPKEGDPLETFTILTTEANEILEPIHNRMPVILEPKNYRRWMEPASAERLPVDLLRPFDAERMTAWPVSECVGNVRNNDPELLARTE